MRVIAVSTLKALWSDHPEHRGARGPTLACHRDVKAQFGTASILQNGRAMFNIAGNKYRIVVWINYPYRVVSIRFIGTHELYDDVDAQTI